jgi:phosphate butyryltransferase
MFNTFADIIASARQRNKGKIAVAAAADADVLIAVQAAKNEGIADAILVGDSGLIRDICQKNGIDADSFEIDHVPDVRLAAKRAAKLVRDGQAKVMMKGLVGTADFMRAVLDKTDGLGSGRLISHIAVFEITGYDRLMMLSDAAINIAPDLGQKVQIIENALRVASAMGNKKPHVAMLAAVETVTSSMRATEDAAIISKMAERGQIKGCFIDGPLALDNAVSPTAAAHKGITGEVAGKADLLIAPGIEAGNVLYKSLGYFTDAKLGGIVVGATAPVVMTSRADSPQAKLNSIALALVTAGINS